MKKSFLFVLIIVFGFVVNAIANDYELGGRVYSEGIAIGDESGNGVVILTLNQILSGRYIQKVITTPGEGTEAPSVYTIVFTDSLTTLFTVPARSTTLSERYDVPSSIGRNEIIDRAWTITFTGIGEGNTVTYRIIFN